MLQAGFTQTMSPASSVVTVLAKAGTHTQETASWALGHMPLAISLFRNYYGENFILNLFSLSIFRVRLVERGSPHSLPLMESGKVGEVGLLSPVVWTVLGCMLLENMWGLGWDTED